MIFFCQNKYGIEGLNFRSSVALPCHEDIGSLVGHEPFERLHVFLLALFPYPSLVRCDVSDRMA